MKIFKKHLNLAFLSALFVLTIFVAGCGSSDSNTVITEECIPPIVTSTSPADGAIGVPVNTAISATFSEVFNTDTVNDSTFTVTYTNGDPVSGVVSYANNNTTMIFTPSEDLDFNTTYLAKIDTSLQDIYGNPLDDSNGLNEWSFTTISEADATPPTGNTPPTVIFTIPEDNATDVPLNTTISALISEDLDENTVGPNTFRLYNMTNPLNPVEINGTVTYANRTMTFNPIDENLTANTNYTARIIASIADLEGTTMGQAYEWNFTTGTTVAISPDPVNLGTAGDFTILSKTGISNTVTDSTLVTGDIGVSPATLAAITGFALTSPDDGNLSYMESIYVVGRVYAANLAEPTPTNMTTTVGHMEDAYTEASGLTNPTATELGAGNISGLTLASGIYKWSTGVAIDSGKTVTLSGDANDVWVFQIAQGLTLGSGATVALVGGAVAKNVFWQVGSNVIIGTTATFRGVILSMTEIVVQTGATVEGRLLSQTAVSLDSNIVTQPAP